jgi:dihydrofolate reductase
MKVILHMAITANGYVATEDGDSSWTSPINTENLLNYAKQVGNVVMGHNTYDMLVSSGSFPIPDTLNVVMTSLPPEVDPLKNVLFFTESPEELLEELESRDMNEVLLVGGGQLAGSFMADGLIDEIYLTVEPVIFGQGIHLFEGAEFKRDLELLETRNISDHEIQLHYAVRKYTLDSVLEGSEVEADPMEEAEDAEEEV